MKKAGIVIGVVFLCFGTFPLFSGVFNTGCIALLLTGCFLCYLSLSWTKLKRLFRIAAKTCLIAGSLVAAVISVFMIRQAWFHKPPVDSNPPVIVLGGRVYEYGPSLMVSYRLDAAAAYLKNNPEAICIVSGGQGEDEVLPEATVMARYLTSKHNIESSRIIEEDKSTSTLENIRYSRAFIGEENSVIIVTDTFHQLRASILARNEGLTAYSIPSFTPPGLLPAYWVRDMLAVVVTLITA